MLQHLSGGASMKRGGGKGREKKGENVRGAKKPGSPFQLLVPS